MRRTKSNSLSAYWSTREADVMFCYPDGSQTKSDGHLLYALLNCSRWDYDAKSLPSMTAELESRGYDITTLRFSICKKEGHERWK